MNDKDHASLSALKFCVKHSLVNIGRGVPHRWLCSIYSDEVTCCAARWEPALCKCLRAEVNVRHLCAVVAQCCAVHPWHCIAEKTSLQHHMTGSCFSEPEETSSSNLLLCEERNISQAAEWTTESLWKGRCFARSKQGHSSQSNTPGLAHLASRCLVGRLCVLVSPGDYI